MSMASSVIWEVPALTSRYSSKEIRSLLSSKEWISPHKRVIAMVDGDNKTAEIVEEHARGTCLGGSAWSLYHYTKNSKPVFWSKREGARIFYKVKLGISENKESLIPSYEPARIESAVLEGGFVKVTYSGLAGAGVAALSRGMAEGVEGVEVSDWGGGKKLGRATIVIPRKEKLVIGVDDTDKADEGATWSLVNEIACSASSEIAGVDYLEHAIVQLFPQNPHKTQNCVAVAVSFAVPPGSSPQVVRHFERRLKECSFSKETGMAYWSGIVVPESLRMYADSAKAGMVSVADANSAAAASGVKTVEVTGRRGIIGAVAAVAYVEEPDKAVRL